MKLPYSNARNYDHTRSLVREKKSRLPSATVPDQNYTMREILNRFTSGSPINDMGVYNDFDFEEKSDMTLQESAELEVLPHPKTMDLVDRQNLKERLEAESESYKNKFKKPNKVTKNEESKSETSPAGEEK